MNGNNQDGIGRKNPSGGVHSQLGRQNFVLLTVTTEDRVPWLANSEAHHLLRETWFAATAWLVTDYLLMPDHLHTFCAPRDLSFTIEQWITF
jgi:putative transposase